MIEISVDPDVFAFLQTRATPFVDTPNDVLRRLLLTDASSFVQVLAAPSAPPDSPSTEAFVVGFLKSHFGAGFERRSPYRMMYESHGDLVYFQNFNKEASHLWYRVSENAWEVLRSASKAAWLVLTNPAEGFGFAIPLAELKERVRIAGWSRKHLEVNIDPSTSRWSELDWDLSKYRKSA